MFEHLVPSRLCIKNELIPNAMFHLRFMPLFVNERFVIPFYPNGPNDNTYKKVPNYGLFLIKTIIIVRTNSTKYMQNVCCPKPSPTSLYAIPKFVFNGLTRIGEAKHTLFGDEC